MHKKKRILAVIPARGGSKRIPYKNIKPFLGKPLIAWTIEQAKKSKYIDKIIVSTEDENIAGISRKYGAETPFLRPKSLATDKAGGLDVALHAIKFFDKSPNDFDAVMILQPTSPLRTPRDIDRSIELLFKKGADAVISVRPLPYPVDWASTLHPDGRIAKFIKRSNLKKTRQELPKYYLLNGAIFLFKKDALLRRRDIYSGNICAYVMPPDRSVDIDTKADFKSAELSIRRKCETG